MLNKYIKESKVIKVCPGEVVMEVTIDTELLVEDISKGLTSLVGEMAIQFKAILELVVSFINALPSEVRKQISEME